MAVRRLLVTGGAGFVLCSVVDRWLTVEPTAAAVIFDLARVWDKQVSSQWPPTHACRAGLSTAPSGGGGGDDADGQPCLRRVLTRAAADSRSLLRPGPCTRGCA